MTAKMSAVSFSSFSNSLKRFNPSNCAIASSEMVFMIWSFHPSIEAEIAKAAHACPMSC